MDSVAIIAIAGIEAGLAGTVIGAFLSARATKAAAKTGSVAEETRFRTALLAEVETVSIFLHHDLTVRRLDSPTETGHTQGYLRSLATGYFRPSSKYVSDLLGSRGGERMGYLSLAVVPTNLVYKNGHWRGAVEGGVGSTLIVGLEPAGKGGQAFLVGAVEAGIGPFVEQRQTKRVAIAKDRESPKTDQNPAG